jgi:hypothetical protein
MTRLCGCRPTCHAPRSFCQDRLGRNVGNEPRQARGKRKRKLNNPGWRHFQASRCRPSVPASQSTVSQSVVWLDPSARSTAPHRPAAGRAEETLPCCSCIQFHLCTQQQTSTAKQHRLLTFEFSLCLSRACLGNMFVFIYNWLKKDRFCSLLGCLALLPRVKHTNRCQRQPRLRCGKRLF